MKETSKDSTVISFIRMIWKHSAEANSFSWERYNQALSIALSLAITSGMKFEEEDFKTIHNDFRFEYWGGADGGFAERFYGQAVAASNISACIAFEAWKNRRPYIFDNVLMRQPYGRTSYKARGRLAVGSKFDWEGHQVQVTSFAEDGSYLTACAYKPYEIGKPAKISRRYKITRKELLAERKRREAA